MQPSASKLSLCQHWLLSTAQQCFCTTLLLLLLPQGLALMSSKSLLGHAGWCQTGKGMCASAPPPATAISTAFVVRKTRSLKAGTVAKRSWLQKSGVQAVPQWMPVWQYHPEDKTSSVWVYRKSTAGWPTQKLTYTGINSMDEGRRMLQGQTVRHDSWSQPLCCSDHGAHSKACAQQHA